jgi:hypothetical protein
MAKKRQHPLVRRRRFHRRDRLATSSARRRRTANATASGGKDSRAQGRELPRLIGRW